MPTSKRDAKFLMRMIAMMLAGAGSLLLGVLLDTPDEQ